MSETWMSYREAAAKLGSSVGTVRKRALRGRWPRQAGNDGKARILVPDETSMGRPTPVHVDVVSTVTALQALQAHVETLKAELAASVMRADKLSTALAVERELLATACAAADRATVELVTLAQRLATIAEERSQASSEPPRRSTGAGVAVVLAELKEAGRAEIGALMV
jgi:hypothetical protein